MIQRAYLRFVILISLLSFAIVLPVTAQDKVIGVDAKFLSAETRNPDVVAGERAFYEVTLYNANNNTAYINFSVKVTSPTNRSLILYEHSVEIAAMNSISVIPKPISSAGEFQLFILRENGVYTITVDTKTLENFLVTCTPFLNVNLSGNYTTFCLNSAYTYQNRIIEIVKYVPTPQERSITESSYAIANNIQNISLTLQTQTIVLEKLESRGTKLQQATLLAALLAIFVAIFAEWSKIRKYIAKATLEDYDKSELWKIRERTKKMLLLVFLFLSVAYILDLGGWSFFLDFVNVTGIGVLALIFLYLGVGIDYIATDASFYLSGFAIFTGLYIIMPSVLHYMREKIHKPLISKLGLTGKSSFKEVMSQSMWLIVIVILTVIANITGLNIFFKLLIIPSLLFISVLLQPNVEKG